VDKKYLIVALALLLAVGAGCKNDVQTSDTAGEQPQIIKSDAGYSGTVAETMDASGYTYVLIDTGSEKLWVAGPRTALKVGDEVFVPEGSPIANFESKTLGRTFENIIFASAIVSGNADQAFEAGGSAAAQATPTVQVVTDFSDITKAEGGKTVAEIFGERKELNEQSIKVRGKVVKYMSGIMGKNWLHVKDGTGAPGTDDLVVTTLASAKVGDKVLVSGKVAADKDFGSGYRYDVIVEDAEVAVE